jgi:hypothetical protein
VHPRLRPAAAALVLAVTTVLTGCSGSVSVGTPKAVDADDLADTLASRIDGDDGSTIELTCEDDLPAEVDATVDCWGTDPDGATTGIRPVVTSVDGDDVAYDAPLFLPADELATQLRAQLEQQGYPVEDLTCEELAGEVGAAGTCTVQIENAPETGDVEVEIVEVDGLRFRFSWRAAD